MRALVLALAIVQYVFLVKGDAYSCGPGNPCSNGACCGVSGYCGEHLSLSLLHSAPYQLFDVVGYGPTYCGTGCTSNVKTPLQFLDYRILTRPTISVVLPRLVANTQRFLAPYAHWLVSDLQ